MEMAFCGTSEGTRSGDTARFSAVRTSLDGCTISDMSINPSATIDGVFANMALSADPAGWSLEFASIASERS